MKLPAIFSTIFLICSLILISITTAHSAEIININYKYRIAFADLTEKDVGVGDMVTIITPDGYKTKLKVVETYPVMIKLGVAEGDMALTDDQFSAITIGSQVVSGGGDGKAARVSRVPDKTTRPKPNEPYDVPLNGGGARTISPAAPTVSAVPSPGGDARCAEQDQRLEQMLANNIKMTENVAKFLAEKNAAEAKAREKEAEAAAAVAKAEELAAANAALVSRVKAVEAAVSSADKEKAAKQKEIDDLNLKLGELKKKLAKMVEIVNTNMKAYEK